MVLGRNGLRDERRRRVLIDETLHAAESDASGNQSAESEGKARARAKAYSEAARVGNHAPISACIPKRPLSIWGLFLAGACLIAAIESLYAQVYLSAAAGLRPSLTALDVTARGSLASWFASVVLCCAALSCSLVYLIRRHRTDDYRGRYRWWLWLAPLLVMLSVNAGTGLHQILSGVLTKLSGAEIAVGGKGWWILAYTAIFFPIVVQLLIELWPSRLASLFFGIAVTAYVLVAAFELHAVQCSNPLATTMCHSSLLLSAHFAALLTVLSYGRYVYLEAHDSLAERRAWRLRMPRIPKMKKKPKKKKVKESDDSPAAAESKTDSKKIRVDGSHSKFGQEGSQAPQVTLASSNLKAARTDDQKVSKSDRKRLRKEGNRT